MALSKKSRKKLLGFYLAHPLQTGKILLSVKRASDLQLVAIAYHVENELDKRGIK